MTTSEWFEWFHRSLGPVSRTGLARKFREALIVGGDERGVAANVPCAELTGQEKVCYNLPTAHGQMLRVVGSLWESAGFTSLQFPLDKTRN